MIFGKPFFWWLCLCALCLPASAAAQRDTVQPNRINLDNARSAELLQINGREIKKLKEEVVMQRGDATMYCDSAFLFENNDIFAYGNVRIKQGDSLTIFADSLRYMAAPRVANLFSKDVVLVNGRQRLFADRQLTYNLATKIANYNDGALLDNGKTQLTCRRGTYFVKEQEALFRNKVVVRDTNFSLQSDSLRFNTQTQVATFLAPTRIFQDSARIYCEAGFYDTEQRVAALYTNAQYQKNEQKARADTILYDGKRRLTTLIGNALSEDGKKIATADRIAFDEANGLTTLDGNPDYRDDQQHIKSKERIIYNNEKKTFSTEGRTEVSDGARLLEADNIRNGDSISVASGNIIFRDTAQNTTILCEHLVLQAGSDSFKAFSQSPDSTATRKRPMLKAVIDRDTLFLSADTLVSFKKIIRSFTNADSNYLANHKSDTMLIIKTLQKDSLFRTTRMMPCADTAQLLLAFRDVRIFKSDLQVVSDSLAYNSTDSLFYFYKKPIIWSDTSQFSADTIRLAMSDNKIKNVYLRSKAFIANSPDESIFNQIKGDNAVIEFDSGAVRQMHTVENAESIYYVQDEKKAYVGPNRTKSNEIFIIFKEKKIDRIKFIRGAVGRLTPMKQAKAADFRLSGFFWEVKRRPKSVADLQ